VTQFIIAVARDARVRWTLDDDTWEGETSTQTNVLNERYRQFLEEDAHGGMPGAKGRVLEFLHVFDPSFKIVEDTVPEPPPAPADAVN